MMTFTSVPYYLFLFLIVGIFYVIPSKWRAGLLLLASYIFYISFDYRYLGFIFLTTISSYFIARRIEASNRKPTRRLLLSLSMLIEFSMLFSTKYLNSLLNFTHWSQTLDIIVPIGISFYTFQTVGYMLDVYRGSIAAEKNFVNYAVFLSFFPHLLSGPIEPGQNFLPQLNNFKSFVRRDFRLGIGLIVFGLFKKFVIADRLAPLVDLVFAHPEQFNGGALYLAAFFARYQIYCDFSGYTDIALGSAQLFGLQLTKNFNRPFFSTQLSDYWQRWHMSLTKWIRSYVFYPLVSTRISALGVPGLIIITFLFLGLWHGGTYNFILYALLNAVFVVVEIFTKKWREKVPTVLRILFTFFILIVPLTVLFRATDLTTAASFYNGLVARMWSFSDFSFIFESRFLSVGISIAAIGILLFECGDFRQSKDRLFLQLNEKSPKLYLLGVLGLLAVTFYFGYFETNTQFIYFKF